MLELWRERQTFARLRAQNADGRAGPSSTDRSRPTTRWASITPGAGPTRTSTSASTRCSAKTSAGRTASTARACGSRSTSSASWASPASATSRQFGIAEFVSLCKQRVLTYAARQTEQSIRLGMWMDWNDPTSCAGCATCSRGPVAEGHRRGSDGPVTDSVEMIVGRLGMPEIGGSYFTFSNENNDLIWGFLAECNRRGWLYKGHDSMPWCARCGTGLRQMEMNEGYQDRDDPGLTVRFPLVDRPGRVPARLDDDALDADLERRGAVGENLPYVRVRQGDDEFWLGKGTLKPALQGPLHVLEELPGREMVGWRYSGPAVAPADHVAPGKLLQDLQRALEGLLHVPFPSQNSSSPCRTRTYTRFSPTAAATFDVSVQGVVVQTRRIRRAGRPAGTSP